MAKVKTAFVCTQCGASFNKWQGQCTECGEWNVLQEIRLESIATQRQPVSYAGVSEHAGKITSLTEVALSHETRHQIGIAEFDRVLGGGIVAGSVVLIGGDPGIGKSTLLLQTVSLLANKMRVLYVTGEESLSQVAMRATRLGLNLTNVYALAETCIEYILAKAAELKPQLIIIDSIQTIWTQTLSAAPGAVSQVRESAARLVRFGKETDTCIFLVGHVTKEGGIAGPRVLEHMVDAVLYFEGELGSRLRMLRAFKNRFGAVNELGVFAMTDKGLKEVANPSAIFLSGQEKSTPGSAIMVTREGTRPLLVEVQALVDASALANPRRVAIGLEQNRLAMLLAVLHRHGRVAVFNQDVFVNVVGGIRVQETAADLPVVLAILSSFKDHAISRQWVSFGEIGLAGEIRPVPNGEERVREAITHGFECIILPKANMPRKSFGATKLIAVEHLIEALTAVS